MNFVWNRNVSGNKAEKVSQAVEKYWSNFIKGGEYLDNSSSHVIKTSSWPQWPKFETGTLKFMSFNADGSATVQSNYNRAICEKWKTYTNVGALQLERFNQFGYLC